MAKGKMLLAAVFGLVLLIEVVLFAFELFSRQSPAVLSTVVRAALEATLMSLTWRGHRWARLLMGALFGLGSALLLWVIVRTGKPVLVPAELLYLSAAYALLWSPGVREFVVSQRQLRLSGGMRETEQEAPKYESG